MSDIERLANETLELLCKKYPYIGENSDHRLTMQASFEMFRNEIVFLEYCEQCELKTKQNIVNGMRLLYG